MRKLLTIISAICMLAVGCSKKETTTPTTNTNTTDTNFYFTAKIDGVDWSADMKHSSTFAESPHTGFFTISASLPTVTDGFFLTNFKYNGAGTYAMGKGSDGNYIRYTTGTVANNSYSAWKAEDPGSTTTGSIIVTKDEGSVIEGTFKFDGYSEEKKTTKAITDGKFRMKKK